MLQQQLRPKQHIGRKGGRGRPLNCTELHGNEGITMKTMEETMKTIIKRRYLTTKKNNMTQQRSRPKQHIGRKGVWVTTELHGTARKQGNNNEDNARCPNAICEKWKQRNNQ